ncbi:hypothetical protein [Xanthocytophaga agilis]|uniref:Uncharacterized protein n=1 Tax=Xanthocytophaga agilis TaxID=3048010 RepID=A0AAE3RDS4_9BACT|nr:hypothetical protein [Xanthocytophaga agilis]MDJ1506629.1 hypothetical protein [Xanthocytophaga agilis]
METSLKQKEEKLEKQIGLLRDEKTEISTSEICFKTTYRDLTLFSVMTSTLIIIAHAVAYMTHEYSHSFTAWALGWMANPLALDYGPATLSNILFLRDVSDNVSYDQIFAGGQACKLQPLP